MIIDFHTHTFPEKIATKAISKLSASGDTKNYTDGLASSLSASMRDAGIDRSVILPVATSPTQYETINRVAAEVNENTQTTGLISFGGIHPDNENYKEILHSIRANGIKGIKIHPAYQNVDIDDIRFKRIIDCACSLDLVVVTHAGYDVSFPECENVLPEKILNVINELHPPKFVLAHMGGWGCFDSVYEMLAGQDVYFDTSFSITPIINANGTALSRFNDRHLSAEMFVKLVRKHSADKILFGSDSPWSSQRETLEMVKTSGLTSDELNLILENNAAKLLNIVS
jgi:hypothetical protein